MDLHAFLYAVNPAFEEPVLGQISVNVKLAMVERIAQNFVNLVHGAQIAQKSVPA